MLPQELANTAAVLPNQQVYEQGYSHGSHHSPSIGMMAKHTAAPIFNVKHHGFLWIFHDFPMVTLQDSSIQFPKFPAAAKDRSKVRKSDADRIQGSSDEELFGSIWPKLFDGAFLWEYGDGSKLMNLPYDWERTQIHEPATWGIRGLTHSHTSMKK